MVRTLITGVPGIGKTTLAKAYGAAMGQEVLYLNELVEQKKLFSKVDEADFAKVVKLPQMAKAANAWLSKRKSCIAEGHIGCEAKLKVDRVIVLRLRPSELEKRLMARGYNLTKVRANKMSELLDYCTIRSIETYGEKKVWEVDMTGRDKPEQSFEDMGDIIAGVSAANALRPRISWSDELLAEADSAVKLSE